MILIGYTSWCNRLTQFFIFKLIQSIGIVCGVDSNNTFNILIALSIAKNSLLYMKKSSRLVL